MAGGLPHYGPVAELAPAPPAAPTLGPAAAAFSTCFRNSSLRIWFQWMMADSSKGIEVEPRLYARFVAILANALFTCSQTDVLVIKDLLSP
jgi:hypothetical protein